MDIFTNKYIKNILKGLILLIFFIISANYSAFSQCAVVGSPSSGQRINDFCAPVTKQVWYRFDFSSKPPQPSYRVIYFWGDGSPNVNFWPTVQWESVFPGDTTWYVLTEPIHLFPENGNCDFVVNMVLVDAGFQCSDSRQTQEVASWHTDDITLAQGEIRIAPFREEVCEGDPLINFPFADDSRFACNVNISGIRKPNNQPRHVQFIYNTNPVNGRGIPDLSIDVHGTQVFLTDSVGNPVPNSWTVNPMDGSTVAPYSTSSGYFEGPVISTGFDPVGGDQLTFPISFPGTTTVAGDSMEVTIRNWNFCNPWNNDQKNPNAGDARTSRAWIVIIDSPKAPIVDSLQTYCHNSVPNRVSATPNAPSNTLNWYSDSSKTTWLASGNSYVHNKTAPGIYNFYVAETSGVNNCEGPCAEITMVIREPLPQPGSISGPSEICVNTNGVKFSVADDPATMLYGGATEYIWTVPSGWTITSGQGTKEITVNVGSSPGNRSISVIRRYTSSPPCNSNQRMRNITVSPLSVGGTVSGGSTVCQGSNSGTLSLSGFTGSIVKWQVSTNNGTNWTDISHTTASYISPALTTPGTYWYRAVVKSGSCTETYSTHTVVTVDAASVGGTLSGGNSQICLGSTTGQMQLSGFTGNVVRWQWRRNTGSWNDINTTSTSYTHTPSNSGSYEYRVVVKNGSCGEAYSSVLTTEVHPTTVGGSVGGSKTVCRGSNSGELTLTGHVGAILRWQVSNNGGVNWSNISHTSASYTSNNLYTPGTYWYRAQVRSGVCAIENSDHAVIIVSPTTVGGSVSGGTTVCQGSNSGILTLSGHTGNILRWQFSTNGGSSWTDITNTSTTYTSANLNTPGTYWYRAVVQSPGCNVQFSNHTVVIVNPSSDGGSINGGSSPLCIGSSTGTMTLTGYTGTIERWEKRLDSGTWITISNTSNTYSEIPSSAGTWEYRAVVKSGVCPETYSGIKTIIVNQASVGGSVINGNSPVCYGVSTGTMNLSGQTGNVVRWEKRQGSGSWTEINNTSTSYSEIPNSSGIWEYRAVVKNGACPETNSASRFITVHPRFEAAQLHDNQNICDNHSTNINVELTGGVSTYTINYNVNSVPQTQVAGYSSGSDISTGVLTNGTYTYTLTSVTDINGCPAESLGSPIVINVGSPPSAATINGSDDACYGETSYINFTITGGKAPYTVSYEHNGIPQPAITNYISGTNHPLGVLDVGANSFRITSVFDDCLALVPAGGISADPHVININEVPSADATANNAPSICYDGNTDIVLQSTVANTDFTWTVSYDPATDWVSGKEPTGGNMVNANGNSIVQNLAHNEAGPVTVRYTITPRGPGATACEGPSITRDVIVNPLPLLKSSHTPPAICSGTTFNYTPESYTSSGVSFNWTRTAVPGINPATSYGTGNPNETLVNTSPDTISVVYTYTLTFNGCSNIEYVTVVVNPSPKLSTPLNPPAICSGTTFSYDPESDTEGTTFNWNRSAVSGILPATSNSGTDNPGETLINTTSSPITVTYTYTLSANGCNNSQDVQVVVNPKPELSSPHNPPAICSGASFKYNPASATSGAGFHWEREAIAGIEPAAPGDGNGDIDEVLTNTTTDPITVNYKFTISANGCDNTDTVSVVVNPTPKLSSSLNPSPICSGATFSYTPQSSTFGTAFAWTRLDVPDISPAGPTSGYDNPNESLTNTSTDPITVIYRYTLSANSCNNVQVVELVVNPVPVLSSTLTPDPICSGATFSYEPKSLTPGTSFTWTRTNVSGITPLGPTNGLGNPNETLTNITAAPITVIYTYNLSANGCTNTQQVSVTVNPTPVLNSSLFPDAICDSSVFNYTPTSLTSGTSFSWERIHVPGISPAGPTYGTDNPGETLYNSSTEPISVTYRYTLTANSCSNIQNVQVNVNPTPLLTSTLNPSAICSGDKFIYVPESSTSSASFSWTRIADPYITSPGPGSGTGNVEETLINTSDSLITVKYIFTITANACSHTQTVSVDVKPTPKLSSTLYPDAICSGNTFSYNPESLTSGTSFKWDRAYVPGITPLGPTQGMDSPDEILINNTNSPITVVYKYTLIANGCSNTQDVTFVVNPIPTLSSSLAPDPVCSNTPFTYTPFSGTSGTSFHWERAATGSENAPASGDDEINETLRNRSSVILNAEYEFTLSANGCTNIQTVSVGIKPEPVISDQSVSVCSGEMLNHKILLDNFSNPDDNVTFTWLAPTLSSNISGGTDRFIPSKDNMTDVFSNTSGDPGTAVYTVTPYYQGCQGETRDITVTIGSQPVLDPNLDMEVCSSLPTGLILKVDSGSVAATSYDVLMITREPGLEARPGNKSVSYGVNDDFLANDVFINKTGEDKIVTYLVRPLFGANCIGDSVNIKITIKPQPVIVSGQTAEICSGSAVNKEIFLDPVNTPANSKFNWSLPLMSDGPIQGSAGNDVEADPAGKLHITDVFTNYGSVPITATYKIVAISDFGCSGDTTDLIVNVKPEPAAPVISGPARICTGGGHIIYTVPPKPGSTFTWTVPPEVGSIFLDANTNTIIINSASSAGSGQISVIETNSFNCSGPSGSFDVEVFEASPEVLPAGKNIVCANATETYSVPFHAGSVYTWTLPPGAGITGDPTKDSITVTFSSFGGNISVKEENIAGCITHHPPLAVTVRPLPTATIANNATICEEDSHNFNITFTGTGPWDFVYAIDGVPQPAVSGVSSPYALPATLAGNYTIVSVTDANGCTGPGIGNATLTHFTKSTASIIGSTEICTGESAVLTISLVGYAPFNFVYTDGTTQHTVNNYPANIYTTVVQPLTTTTYEIVSFTDNNSCEGIFSGSAEIIVNPLPVLNFDVSHLQCSGDNSGSIELTVSGATAGSYSWTGPGGFLASTKDISGLAAGQYTVSVQSDKGCITSGQVTVIQPPQINLNSPGNIMLPCNGDNSGSGTFTVSGGTAPYFFSIESNSTGATFDPQLAESISFNGAAEGSITIKVRDNNGCEDEKTIVVSEPDALKISAVLSTSLEGSHNINCFGDNTGTIAATVTGGIAPYNLSWSTADGSGLIAGSANQYGLSAGTYNLTVTDANACTITDSYTLSQPDSLYVTATTDDDSIGACLNSSAQLNAIPGGGVMPSSGYIYSWYPANGLSSTNIANPTAKPATTTTYTVTITDENGCNASSSVTVYVLPAISLSLSASDHTIGSCPASFANLNVTVSGGEAPYTYQWNNGLTLSDSTIANPVAKPNTTTTYTVIVTDANNCQVSADITINVAPDLNVTADVDDDLIGTCPDSKARLSSIVTGGEGPYTYLWDHGAFLDDENKANPVAKPVSSTLFTLYVTDANGCTASAQVMVNVAPDLSALAFADDSVLSTCTASFANLDVQVSGGEAFPDGEYSYSWSPSSGLNYANVKSPVAKPSFTTTYTVTVSDRNGCTAQSSVTIEIRLPIAISYTTKKYNGGYDISCNGVSDGEIDITVTGGEGPYSYEWSGPGGFNSSSEDITDLIAGNYTVTVTDANNCKNTATITLVEPAILSISKTPDINLNCFGDANASGLFNISGGTVPYSFNIDNNAAADITSDPASVSFFNGSSGSVGIEVTDDNGCISSEIIYISQPDELLPGSVTGNQEVCYLGDPFMLNELDAPSGGPSGVYNYQWESASDIAGPYNPILGASASTYDPPAGIMSTTYYRRRVISGICDPVYSDTLTITVNPLPIANISGSDFICPADNATLVVNISQGSSPFTVELSDGTIINNYISGTDIIVNPVINTSYTIASITDSKGCSVTAPHANLSGSALITIKVIPEISQHPVDQTVCEHQPVTFSADAGMTTNPSFQWHVDRNDGSGPQILPGETNSNLTFNADRSMNAYKYSVEVSGDCSPSLISNEAVLTVNNLPEISVQPDSVVICSGEDAVFTVDPGTTSGETFAWYVNTGFGWNLAIGSRYQGTFNDTLTVVSVSESMSGNKFRVRVSGVCDPFVDSDEVSLTVTRQAEIISSPANVNICEDGSAIFSVNAGLTTGPTYIWQIFNGTIWEDIPGETDPDLLIPVVTSAMNGNIYRVIVNSSCGSSINSGPAILTVYEKPEILTQPKDTIVCAGANVNFSIDPGLTTGPEYQWQVSTNGGVNWSDIPSGGNYMGVKSPVLNIYSVDSSLTGYMYKVKLSGICTPEIESDPARLTINTAPRIIMHPTDTTVCEGESTDFEAIAVGTALSWQWQVDMRDGSGFVNFSDSAGIYTGSNTNQLQIVNSDRRLSGYRYRAVISGICTPPAITNFAMLTINTPPEITGQPLSDTICEYSGVNFSVNAQGAGLSFKWQESIAGGPFNDLTDTGNYIGTQSATLNMFNVDRSKNQNRYRVVIGGICGSPVSSDVAELIVKTSPEIIIPPSDTTVCQNVPAKFSVTAIGSDLHYQWQVSSGGSYSIIFDGPEYSGVNTSELTILNPEPIMNNYRYRVSITGTCVPPVNSNHGTLHVLVDPQIHFHPEDAEICENDNTSFTAIVTGDNMSIKWQVDDNSGSGFTDINDGAEYSGSESFTLNVVNAPVSFSNNRYRLKIVNICNTFYTDTALLVVNPNPSASITGDGTFPLVCGGTDLNLDGNPSGGTGPYIYHNWSGAIAPLSTTTAQHTVFNTLSHGDYEIFYTVTDSKNCKGSTSVTIENNRPDANFISNAVPSCGYLMVNFTNQSERAISYSWDFDDGSPAVSDENPSHGFDNYDPEGKINYYKVRLVATSDKGCRDTAMQTVTIYPKVDPVFTITPDEGCNPLKATLTTKPGAYSYEWDFGDGNKQVAGYSVVYEFNNLDTVSRTYNVVLTSTSYYSCKASSTMPVTVHPTPLAAFSAVPPVQTYPDATVTINNLVAPGPWNFIYYFGDGSVYTEYEPSHTYADPGTYTITQIVSSGYCTDSTKQSITIKPTPPIADFIAPDPGCNPWAVKIINTSLYASTYYWDFGDGGTSTQKDPEHIYLDPGTYVIRLTATGPGGIATHAETIEIFETPRVAFNYAPDTVFEDYKPAKFFNFTVGAGPGGYLWDFGDIHEQTGAVSSQNTSNEYEPIHVYEHPGWKDVKLIAFNEFCSDTLLKEHAILVLPRKEFIFPDVFRPNPTGPSGGYYDRTDPHSRNSVFFPAVSDDVLEFHMYIYNRWGELVFESDDINRGWDGYIKDRLASQGVYVWKVKGKYLNGENFVFAGNVTLLH